MGRAYREPGGAWLTATKAVLAEKVANLKEDRFDRIALVAGSLGALPALHFLAESDASAAVLVSPVYNSNIPSLVKWDHLFGDTSMLGVADLASTVSTPLLILHGLRDEVAASEQSSYFVSHLSPAVSCKYVTFPDEGHIFRNSETWEEVLSVASAFLLKYLGTHNVANRELTS
jgi:alpha-beta hydrolase superfamily lysophospholipase